MDLGKQGREKASWQDTTDTYLVSRRPRGTPQAPSLAGRPGQHAAQAEAGLQQVALARLVLYAVVGAARQRASRTSRGAEAVNELAVVADSVLTRRGDLWCVRGGRGGGEGRGGGVAVISGGILARRDDLWCVRGGGGSGDW